MINVTKLTQGIAVHEALVSHIIKSVNDLVSFVSYKSNLPMTTYQQALLDFLLDYHHIGWFPIPDMEDNNPWYLSLGEPYDLPREDWLHGWTIGAKKRMIDDLPAIPSSGNVIYPTNNTYQRSLDKDFISTYKESLDSDDMDLPF